MSIHEFLNKIKSSYGIDIVTLMYFCVVIGVGCISFLLGRYSVEPESAPQVDPFTIVDESPRVTKPQTNVYTASSSGATSGSYLASKNGKMYYTIGCKAAKRIAEKNIVWFQTKEEAERAGYTLSTSCK